MHIFSKHQEEQIKIIDEIESRVKSNSVKFSTVSAVDNYPEDTRLCLTSVHLPRTELLDSIEKQIISPLRSSFPDHFYYPSSSLHITVKNVRVINDPPHFSDEDEKVVAQVFADTVPQHMKYDVYFFRLLLFSGNLALVGTTEEHLDDLILDLDRKLSEAGVADDKKYVNDKYFFCNMTLARFSESVPGEFVRMVEELSASISFEPYTVDSVTLLTCNAVLKKRQDLGRWNLAG